MIDLLQGLSEPSASGVARELRVVSGPQGPRVVLDGRSVLLLGSDNCLGLAEHPRVREAAADAALRWGAGAGAARSASGGMTPHGLLEERLAAFHETDRALLSGSAWEAYAGVIGALARRGEVICLDAENHSAALAGCRLAGADLFAYDHGDPEHLEWGLRRAAGRAALIVTEGVYSLDGDLAPLPEIARLAGGYGVRLLVDEAHGIGALGPGGRGAAADAGVEEAVDVLVGSLGTALGTCGAYVCCDRLTHRHLLDAAARVRSATAPPPPVAAGSLAALELLLEQPRRVDKLRANADALREALSREGLDAAGGSGTHIVSFLEGAGGLAARVAELALEGGVLAVAAGPARAARLRLAVMATHSKPDLRDAARVLGRAASQAGFKPARASRAALAAA